MTEGAGEAAMGGKAYKGMAMEGRIASWYARNTRSELRAFRACAERVAASVPAGARVLEVAPGPGYLALELARRDYRVSGLDISESFVRIARENARDAGLVVHFRQGNAADMPYADQSFDFVLCRSAFKNFADPLGAIDEMHRVLVPGGQAWIQDLRKEASRQEIDVEVDGMRLSRMNALLTRWIFRTTLLKNAYSREAILTLAEASRFGGGDLRRDGIGFELRLTKATA